MRAHIYKGIWSKTKKKIQRKASYGADAIFDETKYGTMGPDGQQYETSSMLLSAAVNLDNDNPLYIADDDDMSRFV